jgi:hypothetical protein
MAYQRRIFRHSDYTPVRYGFGFKPTRVRSYLDSFRVYTENIAAIERD